MVSRFKQHSYVSRNPSVYFLSHNLIITTLSQFLSLRFANLRSLQSISAIVLLLFFGLSQATTSITEQVKTALEDELYPFSSIVPGYQRPATNPPKFAVAEFRVDSDDLIDWSKAVSEILRYKIQYVPGVRLYMPAPHNTFVDSQVDDDAERPLLINRSDFKNLNQTLGIESVLTGSVAFNGKEYTLSAEIVDLTKEDETLLQQWSFPPEDLATVLINISEWVYASLAVELTAEERAYLKDEKTLGHEAVEDFISLYTELKTLKGPIRKDKINQLQTQHPDFVMFAIYALFNRIYAQNLDDAYKNLEQYESLRSGYQGNAGITLESYRAMEIDVLPKHKVATRLNNLKNLLKEQPNDPTIIVVLADALVNNGNSLEGIATLLEAVEQWPNFYRTWWSLGWALNKHSWQVRGHSKWRDVPEKAKKAFNTLSLLANLAIDEALRLNPLSSALWNLKINSLGAVGGYSDELMLAFEKAVKLAPKEKSIYKNALNYSAKKWYGNAGARRHIIELAIENNPEENWPVILRNRHLVDFDPMEKGLGASKFEQYLKYLIDHPQLWRLVITFIVSAFLLAFALGIRSAIKKNKKANPNVDQYP